MHCINSNVAPEWLKLQPTTNFWQNSGQDIWLLFLVELENNIYIRVCLLAWTWRGLSEALRRSRSDATVGRRGEIVPSDHQYKKAHKTKLVKVCDLTGVHSQKLVQMTHTLKITWGLNNVLICPVGLRSFKIPKHSNNLRIVIFL